MCHITISAFCSFRDDTVTGNWDTHFLPHNTKMGSVCCFPICIRLLPVRFIGTLQQVDEVYRVAKITDCSFYLLGFFPGLSVQIRSVKTESVKYFSQQFYSSMCIFTLFFVHVKLYGMSEFSRNVFCFCTIILSHILYMQLIKTFNIFMFYSYVSYIYK